MAGLHALRTFLFIGLVISLQCLAAPELQTAWIVAGCALALLALTAGMAILMSGQYRGK